MADRGGPKWGLCAKFFVFFILILSAGTLIPIQSQWIEEEDLEFRRFPGGRLFPGHLGSTISGGFISPDRYEAPDALDLKKAEKAFREASKENQFKALRLWAKTLDRASPSEYRVDSDLENRLWQASLSDVPFANTDALRLIKLISISERSQALPQKAYRRMKIYQDWYELSLLREIVVEQMSEALRLEIVEDLNSALQSGKAFEVSVHRELGAILRSLNPEDAADTYDQLAHHLWDLNQPVVGLRALLVDIFLELDQEQIRTDLYEQLMIRLQRDEEPDLAILSALMKAFESDEMITEKIVNAVKKNLTNRVDKTQADSVKALGDQVASLVRLLKTYRRDRVGEFAHILIELAQDPSLDLDTRRHIVEHNLKSPLQSGLLSATDSRNLLRFILPQLYFHGSLDYHAYHFSYAARSALERGDQDLFGHFYFLSSIFMPALQKNPQSPVVNSYVQFIDNSPDWETIELNAAVLSEALLSAELRERALAQEIARSLLSDTSFDQLVDHLQQTNQTQMAFDLILERDRISEESTDYLIGLMSDEDFHAHAAIYFASQRWGASASTIIRAFLQQSNKYKSDRESRINAISNFVDVYSKTDFWNTLELKEVDDLLFILQITDRELGPEPLQLAFQTSFELIQSEEIEIDLRIELATAFFHLLRSKGQVLPDTTWREALELADWCFDRFFDRVFDEALLFFYRAVQKRWPAEANDYEERIKELL